MFRFMSQKLLPAVTNTALRQSRARLTPTNLAALSTSAVRRSDVALPSQALTDEQKDAAWIDYFDNPDIDYFDFALGFTDLWQEDAIPEPTIIQSALYACRRLNNMAAALRCMEMVRIKCGNKKEIYDYVIQELGPTFDDLGLKTPEQLGLDQVSD